MQKYFLNLSRYFLDLSRWSGSVLTVYVIQLAAKLITIISSTKLLTRSPGAAPAQTRTVERWAGLKLMLCQRKMVKLTPLPDKLYKLTPTICLRIDPDTGNGRVLLCLMFRILSGSQNTDFWKYILTFYHCCFATQIDNCSKTRFPTQIGLKIKFAN